MASVNFMKVKSRSSARAYVKHCDKDEREKNNHSNKDINKALSKNNAQLKLSVDQTMKKFSARIEQLDKTTNTNFRKDRVEAFMLEVPVPENLSDASETKWARDAIAEIVKFCGKENVINVYYHQDEKHAYIDHGKTKLSRNHLHCFVVPCVDGKLNGKKFSSKSRMKELNKSLDSMTREKYSVQFLKDANRTKENRVMEHHTVEELKALSNQELEERIQYKKQLEADIQNKSAKRSKIASEIDDGTKSLSELQSAISEQKTLLNTINHEITELQDRKTTLEIKVAVFEAKFKELKDRVQHFVDDYIKENKWLTEVLKSAISDREREELLKHNEQIIPDSFDELPTRDEIKNLGFEHDPFDDIEL